MTSSQEPQLTRREMRERERLQQQATSPTPNDAPAALPPVTPVVQQPIAPPAPVPAYAAPTPAGQGSANGIAVPRQAPPASPYGQPSQVPAPYPNTGTAAPVPAPLPPAAAAPVSFAPTPATPAPAAPPAPSARTPERTLTRRELRAMLGDAATDHDDLDDVDVDEVAGATAMDAPRAPASAAYPSVSPVPTTASGDLYPPTGMHPNAGVPRQPIPHQESAAAAAEQPLATPKPVGHWTSQLDAPVEPQPYDQVLSRGGVGRGVPTTTNALILPSLPDHTGIPAPLADNGEIIVTGSIDLPRSYGATGVHPSQIDSADVDRLFDQVEDGASAGAPVSATRAISTQSAAKAVMTPPSKEGMNVPLVLAVTAGVLALGVVATLVIGALTGLF
ncbi:hypothetical protein [Agromyces salentinus]|uniref:Uncharacterized protein n=1 Tax=Agromyces salentinus TaxID=269421 RepID=A0ABP4Z6I1_9MICO|nr:hypothetical protein [Agromyces salentinus]